MAESYGIDQMVKINRRLSQSCWRTFHHQASVVPGPRYEPQILRAVKMHSEKALMDKAADKLIKKAADCFDVAETQLHVADQQHQIASKQHCSADELEMSAHKLEALGHALEADAAEIKGNTQVIAVIALGIRPHSAPPTDGASSAGRRDGTGSGPHFR
jgi:hypothetical protein